MKKISVFLILSLLGLVGCVSNDLPYPLIVPNITSVEVDGAESVDINQRTRRITINLPETSDVRKVSIRSVQTDREDAVFSKELSGVHDLTDPLRFTVTIHEDFNWTITAVRNVERYFTVKGQIGSTTIDAANRRAIAMVGTGENLANITVTSLKLGAEGLTSYSSAIESLKNFTSLVHIDVTEFDQTSTWSLIVEQTDISIGVQNVNAWATSAYVTTIEISVCSTIRDHVEV